MRVLNVLGAQAWYYQQIFRLAAGLRITGPRPRPAVRGRCLPRRRVFSPTKQALVPTVKAPRHRNAAAIGALLAGAHGARPWRLRNKGMKRARRRAA
jgi:hypothetical protein